MCSRKSYPQKGPLSITEDGFFCFKIVSQADMHKMYYYLIISAPLHIPFHRKKYGYGGYHEIQNIENFLVYLDSP